MRNIIVVGDPLISDGRSGSHCTNTALNPVIKCISGQTGASLCFSRDTRGFSVVNYNNRKKTVVYHTVNGDHALFHTSKTAKMIQVILLSITLTF